MNRDFSSVDIILPVYNEGGIIEAFYSLLVKELDNLSMKSGIIFVNDGSSDDTQNVMKKIAAEDARVRIIELSRNFGHQAALCAGYDNAKADLIISMDSDGQNPPRYIHQMIAEAQNGYDVVIMQRHNQARQGGKFKQLTSNLFYKVINILSGISIPEGAADFRLLTRRALDALLELEDYSRFLRGMISWIGFPSIVLPFTLEDRIEGSSKYSLRKMFALAVSGITSFSLRPLYFLISIGVIFIVFAVLEAIYVLSFWFRGLGSTLAPGWSSLMFVILFTGGSVIISMGVLGIYIGQIFQEVKGRPVYIIKNIHN